MNYHRIPYLYKRIISPKHKNCGFVGFVATFNWVQVSDLQARWFIKYIMGQIKLPSQQYIMKNINKEIEKYKIKTSDYHDFAYLAYTYSDMLAKDIKIKPKTSKLNPGYWFSVSQHDEWKN